VDVVNDREFIKRIRKADETEQDGHQKQKEKIPGKPRYQYYGTKYLLNYDGFSRGTRCDCVSFIKSIIQCILNHGNDRATNRPAPLQRSWKALVSSSLSVVEGLRCCVFDR